MSSNYPSAVDNFPVHTDNMGEKIAAATLNNLQDSVVAIENALGTTSAKNYVDTSTAQTVNGAKTFGSPITLPADPTSALQASTKQYVDNLAIFKIMGVY